MLSHPQYLWSYCGEAATWCFKCQHCLSVGKARADFWIPPSLQEDASGESWPQLPTFSQEPRLSLALEGLGSPLFPSMNYL